MGGEWVMNLGFMFFLGATLVNLASRVKNSLPNGATSDAMLDLMAIAPARQSSRDIEYIVRQPHFSNVGITEQIMVAQDLVQAAIRPGMSYEDAVHARELFIVTLLAIKEGTSQYERELLH